MDAEFGSHDNIDAAGRDVRPQETVEREATGTGAAAGVTPQPIHWMSTKAACERLGVTLRTLYRFIDEGQLTAYKMGRVIRLQGADVEDFIGRMRISPGTLEHLYPEPRGQEHVEEPDAERA